MNSMYKIAFPSTCPYGSRVGSFGSNQCYVGTLKKVRSCDGVVNFVCHCSCDFGFYFSCFTLVAEHFSVPWSPTPEDASGNYIFNKWWCPK